MKILQSRSFERKVRKVTKPQKRKLDSEIQKIIDNLSIGTEKKGDLRGVFVHKFKIHTQVGFPVRLIRAQRASRHGGEDALGDRP